MKKFQKLSLLLALVLLLAVPAAAAQYSSAYDLFVSWEQNGYPDFVAGVYSVDGGSMLAIQLVAGCEDQADTLRAMVDGELTIEFGAAYSYSELQRINEEIVEQYLGDGAVFSCGIGWMSVDGEVIGFGESGTESRVTVGVKAERAQEYAAMFYEKYGGAVVVESSEGIVVDSTAAMEELALDAGHTNRRTVGYVVLALLLLTLTAGTVWLRGRRRLVVQTADGRTVTASRMSRRAVCDAVRRSEVEPARGFEDLKTKL